jgi:hypothetical protein
MIMRIVLVFALAVACVLAQDFQRNRLTFSSGWSQEIGGSAFRKDTAVSLGVSYGRRLHTYIEAEAGVFTGLQPRGQSCASFGCFDPDDRFIWIPFGLRFIDPVIRNRLELSAGGGGLYEKYSIDNPNPAIGQQPYEGWGGYFVGGFSARLIKQLWLGAGPRFFLGNPDYRRDRWIMWSGEVSWRF